MRATGIVRRIDDLGRVVIPKEIRRFMHLREGDPLEIFTDKGGGVIFKKYSCLQIDETLCKTVCAVLHRFTGNDYHVAVTDRNMVIACSISALNEKEISSETREIIDKRLVYVKRLGEGQYIFPVNSNSHNYHVAICVPIFMLGELVGSILLLTVFDEEMNEELVKSTKMMADMLSTPLEN